MFKKMTDLYRAFRNLKSPLEMNLAPYEKILEEIDRFQLRTLNDEKLKIMSCHLKKQAEEGIPLEDLLIESFALVREVSHRVLGMRHFDVQVLAGVALHRGKIVEMQTGEGKTLTAVLPAYLHALTGKGVHILTFNDYLARRDMEWMGPVYAFLGLEARHIGEKMSSAQRKNAYNAHVTYVTAKEAGFDYLRDFLCREKEDLVHRPFHYAIVDEADSLMIDEARIPLVIAGNISQDKENLPRLAEVVRELNPGEDYEFDQYESNIYLTDAGLSRAEELLGCGDLYHPHNLPLLTSLHSALHAEKLLKRDQDYLVRHGKIELIDEFTGRTAENRHWPDNLQGAVEAKEGLAPASRGRILGSIPLQYFLRLYPVYSGMTGTARAAVTEFNDFYGKDVAVIPTNKPCIRKDHPDLIFTCREGKEGALISEIERANKTGQPVLVGTGSVEESERLARKLKKAGVECRVLNAKNDAMEGKIIAWAGAPGAVTVSTNMAGRGVDIKLGGENEEEKERVTALGGLYVIGASRYESRRIDDQLRGRAGRQGDPGESRFFISLEDELIQKHDLAQLIPAKSIPQNHHGLLNDPKLEGRLAEGQRMVEGYYGDMRRQLWNYTYLMEQQRMIVHRQRQAILLDQVPLKLLSDKAPDRYRELLSQVGADVLKKVEKQITLHQMNKFWADFLEFAAYVREGIHLVVIGKKNPLDEFHKIIIEAFDEMRERMDQEILHTFYRLEVTGKGIDLEKAGLKGPSATWTYLINDSPDQFSRLPFLAKLAVHYINRPLFTLRSFIPWGRKK